jgi:hypothetical protein
LRRFADRCLVAPPEGARDTLIEQRGQMRLKVGGRWMPFTAEQWLSTMDVAFCWHARVKMAPLVTGVVEDAFEDGRGRLEAKLWGMISVADAKGPGIDRGEAQRYLGELPWNPLALRHNRQLQFGEGEDGPVRVWAFDPETYVDLRFDADGDIVGVFSRTRSRDDGVYPWEGRFFDYRELGGVRVPTRGEVSWHLPEGEFAYWRGEVTSVGWRSAS